MTSYADHRTVNGVVLPPDVRDAQMSEPHSTSDDSSKILAEHPLCPKCTTRMMLARIMPGSKVGTCTHSNVESAGISMSSPSPPIR
jgi:hypothetical protein